MKRIYLIGGGAALLVILIVVLSIIDAMSGRSETSSPSVSTQPITPPVASGGSPSAPPVARTSPYRTPEQLIDLATAQSPPAAVAPPLKDLVGKWKATVTSAAVDDGAALMPSGASGLPPFEFAISADGNDFVWKLASAGGPARKLVHGGESISAETKAGLPELKLTWDNDSLRGVLESPSPGRGRIQFDAKRQ